MSVNWVNLAFNAAYPLLWALMACRLLRRSPAWWRLPLQWAVPAAADLGITIFLGIWLSAVVSGTELLIAAGIWLLRWRAVQVAS